MKKHIIIFPTIICFFLLLGLTIARAEGISLDNKDQVRQLPHKRDITSKEFYECNEDSDCTILSAACDSWIAVNKKRSAEAKEIIAFYYMDEDCVRLLVKPNDNGDIQSLEVEGMCSKGACTDKEHNRMFGTFK